MTIKNTLSVALLSMMVATPVIAAPVQKEELGKLIREYLNENPEVILESVELYKQKEKERSLQKSKEAIESRKDLIFNSPHDGTIGKKNAKITIVEFFDYNCSACKYMFDPIDALYKEGLDDVRVVFKEYPIFGENSVKLSRIGLAVNALAPEKYYEFHTKMMKHKGSIDAAQAYKYVKAVGLKRADIEKELTDPKYHEILAEASKLGDDLQVRGTPYLIVGDEVVPHALDLEGLRKHIAQAKAK